MSDLHDLPAKLRGPVLEAAQRLIAGSFRRDGCSLPEYERPKLSIPAKTDDDDLLVCDALKSAADRIDELEAALNASEPVAEVEGGFIASNEQHAHQVVKCLRGLIRDGAKLYATPQAERTCVWTEVGNQDWTTSCGNSQAGDCEDMKFCSDCGGRIIWRDNDEASE